MIKIATIPISEIFGPTLQGEGPYTGTPVVFLRTGGCNLHCKFCDTPYTWRFSDTHPHNTAPKPFDPALELQAMTLQSIRLSLSVLQPHVGGLVISGGEPLLHEQKLAEMFSEDLPWTASWDRVEIETAGTIAPTSLLGLPLNHLHFNVSPKLENSGNSLESRFRPEVLEAIMDATAEFEHVTCAFKFVISSEKDIEEVDLITSECQIPSGMVYLMPEGITATKILKGMQMVAPLAIDRGYSLSTRLHTLLWGNTRGV